MFGQQSQGIQLNGQLLVMLSSHPWVGASAVICIALHHPPLAIPPLACDLVLVIYLGGVNRFSTFRMFEAATSAKSSCIENTLRISAELNASSPHFNSPKSYIHESLLVTLTIAPTITARMTGFRDLPNEIVCEVLKLVLPADLESFAQTSRRVFLLSRPFLQEHRKLIRLYATFDNYPPPGQERHTETRDGFSVGPLPTLFRDVLNEPRIGHYIREVKLGFLLEMNFSVIYSNRFGKGSALQKQQYDLIDAAVAQSDLPEIRAKHEHLKYEGPNLNYGGEDLLIALLLPLLPNLNNFSMEWHAEPDSYLVYMARYGALAGFPPLANLKTVRLESPRDGSRGISLFDLGWFKQLPSLKSLTAFNVGYGPRRLDIKEKPLRHQDSHTTELKLLCYHGSSRTLFGYLKSFQSLQNFTFQYHPSRDPINDGDFCPFWVRKALLTCAKTTLRTLRLQGPTASNSNEFMGSLQAFEALREIHTELRFLFPKHSDLETLPSRVLPASLHSLQLQSGCIGDEFQAFFRGIQRAKKETCLHLEDVSVKTKAAKYAWRPSWSAGG